MGNSGFSFGNRHAYAIVQQMMRSRSWTFVVVSTLMSACTNGSPDAHPPTSTEFTTVTPTLSAPIAQRVTFYGLHFDLPPTLQYRADGWVSTMGELFGYYATVPLQDACRTTATTTACSLPLKVLADGAMLVSWGNVGFPHSAGEPEVAGVNTSIAGQAAKLATESPGSCGEIGGDETITAEIIRPMGNHYEMRACIRQPNAVANEQLVMTMLSSVAIDN